MSNVERHTLELNLIRTIEDNESVKQIKESMKAMHEGKLELIEIELETCKIEKGIERENFQVNIKRLEIKNDEALVELKNKIK